MKHSISGQNPLLDIKDLRIPTYDIPADIAQLIERRTREHNVSGKCRVWVRIPGRPIKITNILSDETLKRGPV